MQLSFDFAGCVPGLGLMQMAGTTLRCRVLAVIEAAESDLTGAEIAQRAGLSYRQAVDALNALYNAGKIERTGRKFTARWQVAKQPEPNPLAMLEDIFLKLSGIKRR